MLPVYLALVVGLSLLILIVVFRSILVPLTATLGFVLSLLATFGGITAIFQNGFLSDLFGVNAPGPVLSFLPIIATGILFGLAMDYQLFLVSGMREAYAHGAPARVAVQHGLRAGRAVVTAAAIIMISVFAGFIFSDAATIKPIGFGLAFGVLLDAFVVRMLLIPAADAPARREPPGGCRSGWTGSCPTSTSRVRSSSAATRSTTRRTSRCPRPSTDRGRRAAYVRLRGSSACPPRSCPGRARRRRRAPRRSRVISVGVELHAGGLDVLGDLLGPRGADEGGGDVVVLQHPGDRELRHGQPAAPRRSA